MPRWNPISISGYHIREAGSTAVQELAFTLADGFEYVEHCLDRGLAIDDFAPRLSFFFNFHNDLFEEIAKFRAARRIWAKEMRDTYRARNERSWWMRFHTQTAGVSLTAQQPEVNLVRTTIQALAAVLGGTQSLHTNSMDEALALPSEKAARLALRTQQVIAEESGVANTVDPLGGSYFVEELTRLTEEEAYGYFARIRDMGGVLAAIDNGYIQREIADASYRYQREMDAGLRTIVGVNDYTIDEPIEIPILRMDPEGERRQVERLRETRRARDGREATRCLLELEQACRSGENVMAPLLEAVRAMCTLQEMCDVMRDVFGAYQEVAVV
jgi:methylmalonyl-CoA mutase N-terminal domain/subunit